MAVDTLPMDFGRDKPFYVYLYRDPRRGKRLQPIYVGKGTVANRRADSHWRWFSHNQILRSILAKIRQAGLKPEIEVVGWFDTEESALRCESALIKNIGRRNLGEGPLANLQDGDLKSGPRRVVYSDERRASARERINRQWARPGGKDRFLGHTQSEEFKHQKYEYMVALWANPSRAAQRVDAVRKGQARLSDTEQSEKMKRAWKTRRKFVWEFRGIIYATSADAGRAHGLPGGSVRARVYNGREGRKILLGDP